MFLKYTITKEVRRNFAVSGGVAQAVVDVIKKEYPDKEIKFVMVYRLNLHLGKKLSED